MATQKQAKESIAGGCLCTPRGPFKEFSFSAKGRRGFCAECGAVLSWGGDDVPEEIDIFPGTVDEAFLIGDRTAKVDSKVLKEKRMWEQVLRKEERDSKLLGRELCLPKGGNFFFRNTIQGVTDTAKGGKRFVETESSAPRLVIPH
ncbi:hypothetical protein MMC22_009357 [Lobaria immixta]|nr:hypothetical protein [Lobaria immixta]